MWGSIMQILMLLYKKTLTLTTPGWVNPLRQNMVVHSGPPDQNYAALPDFRYFGLFRDVP